MTTQQIEKYEGRTGDLDELDIPVFLKEIALQLSRLNDRNDAKWKWRQERRLDEHDDAERASARSEVTAMREAYEKLVSVFMPPGKPGLVVPMDSLAAQSPEPASETGTLNTKEPTA